MSESRWVTIPSWLFGPLRPFLYNPSVYSCHFFLISSASVRSLQFLSFIVPILAWNIPFISPNFLRQSLVFSILLFSSISLHCSFKKTLFLLAILWSSAFSWAYLTFSPFPLASLLSSTLCKAFSDNHFCLLAFLFLWDAFGYCFLYNVMNLHP